MKIILFSGKAEAGKTTAATILKDILIDHGQEAVIIPYGGYLKYLATALFDWDGKKDDRGRHLLQWFGTDVVRKKDPDFWAEELVRLARVIDDEIDYFIIDDCRFKNEYECWVRENIPVQLIRIERPGHQNKLTPEQRKHPSETGMDDCVFDAVISATDRKSLEKAVTEYANKEYIDG